MLPPRRIRPISLGVFRHGNEAQQEIKYYYTIYIADGVRKTTESATYSVIPGPVVSLPVIMIYHNNNPKIKKEKKKTNELLLLLVTEWPTRRTEVTRTSAARPPSH
jgi:hypothetical protein